MIALTLGGFSLLHHFRSRLTKPMELALKDVNGELQDFFSYPFSKLNSIWKNYLDLVRVKQENKILKAHLSQLQAEITTYREALIENGRLKKLLQIKRKRPEKSIVANVVGFDLASWRAIITIDVGKKQGVLKDMPVLSQGGVIGRVIEAGMTHSRVMLVTDYNSRVAAIIQRNRARGILKGQGRGGCILDYVKKGIDAQVGDMVITSGLDGIYPKGLILGKIKLVGPGDRAELFQSILVEPASNMDEVEEVLVLLIKKEER